MSQKEIEVILMRQLASYLATPIFLVDTVGTLIFYNEPAEEILGHRFQETGEMLVGDWATAFSPVDENGVSLRPDELPLVIALTNKCPAHRQFSIRGLDKVARRIEVTAFPLIGQADRLLGAIAIFWEVAQS
jgi:hypothetical protein